MLSHAAVTSSSEELLHKHCFFPREAARTPEDSPLHRDAFRANSPTGLGGSIIEGCRSKGWGNAAETYAFRHNAGGTTEVQRWDAVSGECFLEQDCRGVLGPARRHVCLLSSSCSCAVWRFCLLTWLDMDGFPLFYLWSAAFRNTFPGGAYKLMEVGRGHNFQSIFPAVVGLETSAV